MTEPFPEQDKIMAMDQFLAEYFGNNVKTASAPEVDPTEAEKVAQMEIFTKLAADNGIDLEKLSEEQIAYLWGETFKEASGDAPKEDEKGKESEGDPAEAKKEEAKKEHEEKKEAMAKVAEAAYLGKVMAHSLVSELRKISSAHEGPGAGEQVETAEEGDKEASATSTALKVRTFGDKLRSAGHTAAKAVGAAAKKADEVGAAGARRVARLGEGGKTVPVGHNKVRDAIAAHGHRAAAGAAAAGAAGAAAHKAMKKKESSAIDELALEEAVKMAGASGFDVDQATDRVLGVFHLGLLGESEKVASASDAETAVQVRALEFLEAAGYPVTWES